MLGEVYRSLTTWLLRRQLLRSHHRTLRPRNPKRRRTRESVRVFLLQPEESGAGQCAGYGDPAGIVFGVVDGRGLSGYIEMGMFVLRLGSFGCLGAGADCLVDLGVILRAMIEMVFTEYTISCL